MLLGGDMYYEYDLCDDCTIMCIFSFWCKIMYVDDIINSSVKTIATVMLSSLIILLLLKSLVSFCIFLSLY